MGKTISGKEKDSVDCESRREKDFLESSNKEACVFCLQVRLTLEIFL